MRLLRWLVGRVRPAVRREIFSWREGKRRRYADPLALLQALDDRGEWREFVQTAILSITMDTAKLSPALAGQLANKPKIIGDLAAIVRDVFKVDPVSSDASGRPVGLTNLECVTLLTSFMEWCADTSGTYRPLASSPGKSAASPAGSTIADSSAFTSTGPYSVAAMPSP